MKCLSALLALLFCATPALAVENLLYANGNYRGQCDFTFFEHIYRSDQMVGVRQAQQFHRSELTISSLFNTQTLEYTHEQTAPNGRVVEPFKTTTVVNQMGEGLWREVGGKGNHVWSREWKRTEDNTIWNQTPPDRNYTLKSWQMITKGRIYMYQFEKIKLGTLRKFKDGSQNISTRSICTYDLI